MGLRAWGVQEGAREMFCPALSPPGARGCPERTAEPPGAGRARRAGEEGTSTVPRLRARGPRMRSAVPKPHLVAGAGPAPRPPAATPEGFLQRVEVTGVRSSCPFPGAMCCAAQSRAVARGGGGGGNL